MDTAEEQHLAWLARSFGRTDYLPLTASDLAALSDAGSYVEKYPGTHLFKESADSEAAYVIRTGNVELFRNRTGGRLIVGRVGPGAVIGDIALLRGQPYMSSARAVSSVEAFRLDRAKLLPILFDHPRIAIRWLVAGLDQLEATQRRVVRLMRGSVKEQVAEMVLDEADRYGTVQLSQATLAGLLGASRQSVNQSLSELRRVGAVETGYRTITIVDADRLAASAGR
ncbi:MAG: Crp/Fnr family transcriptional regulator [Acidimicrobiia bacterium]